MSNGIMVGDAAVPGRVWAAPMTGVSDLPFRRTAVGQGACYVATEMVASEALISARPEAVRRAAVGEGLTLMVVQLVGADPSALSRAAAIAARSGADIIDLNFGCPAKSVTGLACGSALMRDLDRAETLIRAAVEGSAVPVTVKMRLGWDDTTRNAPELAARAEAAGAKAITVHGRTRQQFYGGRADWGAVRSVKAATTLPVIVNGDVEGVASARRALDDSGADGVMIGRAALGRPWLPRVIEAALDGQPIAPPDAPERLAIVLGHLRASVEFHGETLGVRTFRKHLAAYIDHAPWPAHLEQRRLARASLCQLATARDISDALTDLWTGADLRMAA